MENPTIPQNERRDASIEYLRNNPGCTKEDLVRGVINFSSKKTTLKILNELKREGVVTEEKEKRNSRAYKLFLHNEHILIALSKQITEFKQEFTKLLQKIEAVIPELTLLHSTSKENLEENITLILYYEQLPLFLLQYLMKCLLLKSIVVWPKTIQKEEIRNKLNSLAFTEISKIISDYSNFYTTKLSNNNIHKVNYNPTISDELSKLKNNILFFAVFSLICEKKGIAKEFENLVDKIWLINSDVQEYLHPEARHYHLDYEYGNDNWKKYLNSYRQNIDRIKELENIEKQQFTFLDLNIRNFLL